jgi:hypothetical protein
VGSLWIGERWKALLYRRENRKPSAFAGQWDLQIKSKFVL